jgi:hypothetical protein
MVNGYSGAITNIKLAGEPLTIEKPRKKFDEPIFSGGATVRVLPQSFLPMKDLFGGGELSVKILITLDGLVIFNGFVVPVLYNDPYTGLPEVIEIPATDGLSHLKNVDTYIPPLGDFVSILELIQENLSKTGLELPLRIRDLLKDASHSTGDPLSQTKILVKSLTSKGEPLKAYEVIENVLLAKYSRLYQHEGKWWVERISDIHDGLSTSFNYEAYDFNSKTPNTPEQLNNSIKHLRTDVKITEARSLSYERGTKEIYVEQELEDFASWWNFKELWEITTPPSAIPTDTAGTIPSPNVRQFRKNETIELFHTTNSGYAGRLEFEGVDLPSGAPTQWDTLATRIKIAYDENSPTPFEDEIVVKMTYLHSFYTPNNENAYMSGLAVRVKNDTEDFFIYKNIQPNFEDFRRDTSGNQRLILKGVKKKIENSGGSSTTKSTHTWNIPISDFKNFLEADNDVFLYLTPVYYNGGTLLKENEDDKFNKANFNTYMVYLENLEIFINKGNDPNNKLVGIIDEKNVGETGVDIIYSNLKDFAFIGDLFSSDWVFADKWSTANDNIAIGNLTIQERLIHDLFQFYQKPRFKLSLECKPSDQLHPAQIFKDNEIDPDRKFMIDGLIWNVKWNRYALNLIEHVGFDGVTIN